MEFPETFNPKTFTEMAQKILQLKAENKGLIKKMQVLLPLKDSFSLQRDLNKKSKCTVDSSELAGKLGAQTSSVPEMSDALTNIPLSTSPVRIEQQLLPAGDCLDLSSHFQAKPIKNDLEQTAHGMSGCFSSKSEGTLHTVGKDDSFVSNVVQRLAKLKLSPFDLPMVHNQVHNQALLTLTCKLQEAQKQVCPLFE